MLRRINLTFSHMLVTLLAILSSLALMLLVVQTIAWRLSEAKVEAFSTTVLERSVYLLRQAQGIAQQNARNGSTPPCSEADLSRLRSLLWNYQLIKDVGRVNQQGLICSVLWGQVTPPLPLMQKGEPTKQLAGATFLHLPVANGVEATALRRHGLIVFLSPFAFSRFESDPDTALFSALAMNKAGNERYFSVGRGADELSRALNGQSRWNYIIKKSCSPHYDLCAIAGAHAAGFFNESPIIIGFMLFMSVFTGTLISLCWHFWRSKKTSLSARLQRALAQERLSLVYQPVFEIQSGTMSGVEALLRWEDDDMGAISPEVFIPLAEETGLMRQITEYVTARALSEMGELMQRHPFTLSINISLMDLLADDYLHFLREHARLQGVTPGRLILEITERQGGNLENMSCAIARFKRAGFLIALDDFGTGYSTISWLSQLDVDEIKIDKSLSDSITTHSLNKTLLINLILLLKSMPQKVVFEGLEEAEQVNYLRSHFPQSYGQGWWYSRPLDKTSLQQFIAPGK